MEIIFLVFNLHGVYMQPFGHGGNLLVCPAYISIEPFGQGADFLVLYILHDHMYTSTVLCVV